MLQEIKLGNESIIRMTSMSVHMIKSMPPNTTVAIITSREFPRAAGCYAKMPVGTRVEILNNGKISVLLNTAELRAQVPTMSYWFDSDELGIRKSDFISIFPGNSDVETKNIIPIIVGSIEVPAGSPFIHENGYFKLRDESLYLSEEKYGEYFAS